MKLFFTDHATKDITALSLDIARRIVRKMKWFAAQEDPLVFAKPLKDRRLGTHRFRVGQYRIFVEIQKDRIAVLFVLAVRHRREAYDL